MADRYRKSNVKYTSKKPKRPIRLLWLKSLILLMFIGIGFVTFSYLGYLDYHVREQFEGKRWAIPARVYANPVELYAGLDMPLPKFEHLLTQLNYRQVVQVKTESSYTKRNNHVFVKTREFAFWDKQDERASLLLDISFNPTGVAKIVDMTQNKDVPIIRMDPIQIGSFYPAIKEDRVLIKLKDAPDLLIKGLLASEDRDFYSHIGISFRGIARAIMANINAGGVVQGGSTITQQLVKNFYLTSEKRFVRKIREILMAIILDYRYSKNEILEAYLNEIYLGQNGANSIHGFGLASDFYYGVPLKELSLDQIATLVALVRGPSQYDPRKYPERCLERRNLVLDEMVNLSYINAAQATLAKKRPLTVLAQSRMAKNRYPGFLGLIKHQLKQEYRDEDITSEGLKIFTTLDTQVQDTLEQTVTTKLKQLEKTTPARKLETAVIVTNKESGEIAALVGAREELIDGFNRAIDALRPIGSLIKPVVYLTALQYPDKYTMATRVSDSDITVNIPTGGTWTPKNYDHREHGKVSLTTALAKSYNLATVRVGMDIGVARTAKTLREMGVTREVDLFPSFLLGSSSLTPIEVAQMYQTLADDGMYTPVRGIRAVVADSGKVLQSYPFTLKQAVEPAATYLVNTMLQEVMSNGTGHSAYEVFPKDYGLIGKTGTTNDAKDSWFAGFTGDYLSVVWLGRDDNKPIGLTGSTGALQVWLDLMKKISKQPVTLLPPENIVTAKVDPNNGLLADKTCRTAREYMYIAGSEPTDYSACGQKVIEQDKDWFDDLFIQE